MPEVTSYEPGTFCWVELATSDTKSAKAFYTSLFGWSVNEVPMGDQGTYTMFQKNGKDTGAMYQQGPQEQGVPPHWNNYVAVRSADDSAAKARTVGGNVVAGPFDVGDSGRMAVVMDPQQAIVSIWQAKNSIGAQVGNEPGTFCWNELMTSDIEAARKFYSGLFGWKLKASPEYTEVSVGERPIGGMMQINEQMRGVPPHWMPYFAVADVDGTVKKAQSSGGQVRVPPTDIPKVGRFAVLADSQGAGFAVIKLG